MDWNRATRLTALIFCLTGAPSFGGAGQENGEVLECPDCDAQGRIECPACGGSGRQHEDCAICGGSGERPCKVCSKESNAAGPGRLTCAACRGTGRSASGRELCHRCRGAQSLSCPSCLGRGTRPCVRSIVTGSCALCRRRGTIECTTCGGDRALTREEMARTRASRPGAEGGPEAYSASDRSTPTQRGDDGVTSGEVSDARPPIASHEVLERYDALVATHGDHLDVFAVDPRPELETVRRTAARRLREIEVLPDSVAGLDARALRHDLDAFVERMESFHRRWGALRREFEKEFRTFRTVKDTVLRRAEVLAATPPALRPDEEARLNERVDRALRICESFAAELDKDGLEWVASEETLLRESWSKLAERCDDFLTAAAEAEALMAAEAAARGQESARVRAEEAERERRRTVEHSERSEVASATRREESRNPSPAPAVSPANSPDARWTKAAPERVEARARGDEERDGRGDPPRMRRVPAFVWALGGFALATIVYLLVGRSRERLSTPRAREESTLGRRASRP